MYASDGNLGGSCQTAMVVDLIRTDFPLRKSILILGILLFVEL